MRPTTLMFAGLSTIFFSFQLTAQPGTLDLSFNSIGYTFLTPGVNSDRATDVLPLPDGSSLICGMTVETGGDYLLYVAHLTADGGLDSTFGNQGYYKYGSSDYYAFAYSLALTPDSEILVCGDQHGYFSPYPYNAMLIKLTMGGLVDTAFGTNGVVTTNMGNWYPEARGLVVQSDGKIVVCGRYSYGSSSLAKPMICRYLPNGSLDPAFGNGYTGTTMLDDQGEQATLNDVTVLADGSIVAVGFFDSYGMKKALIIKLDSAGVPDASFGTDGELLPLAFSDQDHADGIATDGQFFFITGSYYEASGEIGVFILKMALEGSIVDTFGDNGVATTTTTAVANDLAIMDSGEILLAGATGPLNSSSYVVSTWLAYFTPDGQLDPQVGSTGIVSPNIPGYQTYANALAIQPDGKVLLAGSTQGNAYDIVVSRYHAGPSLGIDQPVMDPTSLQLYPVPTDGHLFGLQAAQDMSGPMTFTVLDVNGRVVGSPMRMYIKAGSNRFPEEMLHSVPPGLYHLRMMSGSDVIDKPFVLIR